MSLLIDPTTGVDLAADTVERALAAGAHEAEVSHTTTEKFEVNYDTHDVTLVRSGVVDGLNITVLVDQCVGSATLTGRAPDQVQAAVESAVAAARAGAPDPARSVPDGPGDPATDRGDTEPEQEVMVDAVVEHVRRLGADHPKLLLDSSYLCFDNSWNTYANSKGRTQHDRTGQYTAVMLCTGKDEGVATSFDYAGVESLAPITDITGHPIIELLIHETEASFGAKPVPGTFTGDIIFTPGSLDALLGPVSNALNGMSLVRKSSPFENKIGEAVASDTFSLLHRPSELLASTFDASGFKNDDLDVIVDGVLQNFHIGWYASQKLDRPRTTGLSDYIVPTGDQTLDEIIANTERGIVLGRFSGGMPNPALDFSGVAKNSFYVENGEIKFPLAETMIAGNFTDVLKHISAVSSEAIDYGSSRLPWVASSGVTISSS